MKNTTKRILCAVLAFGAVLALSSCNSGRPPRNDAEDTYEISHESGTLGEREIHGTEGTKQTEPRQTVPPETEPVQTEPVQTEPVQTEPEQTEPKQSESEETEPVQTEPVQTEPVQTEPEQTETGKQSETKQTESEERLVDIPPEIKSAPTLSLADVPGSMKSWRAYVESGKELVAVQDDPAGQFAVDKSGTVNKKPVTFAYYLSDEANRALLSMAKRFNMETRGNLSVDTGDVLQLNLAAIPQAFNAAAEAAGYNFAGNAPYAAGNVIHLRLNRLSVDASGKTYNYETGKTLSPDSTVKRTGNAVQWLENFAAGFGFTPETGLNKGYDVGYFRYVGKGIAYAIMAQTAKNLAGEDGKEDTLAEFLVRIQSYSANGTHLRVMINAESYELWYVDGADSAVEVPTDRDLDIVYATGDGYVVSVKN